MRDQGIPVGLVKIRLWRPFPFADVRQALAGSELIVVCDRALSLGGAAGPVLAEVRSAMYPLAAKPHILGYSVGLGGRDVQPEDFEKLVRHAQGEAKQGPSQEFYFYGVRG
jgi:pyruvate ferredoxin oxidoreductase alpha subunit